MAAPKPVQIKVRNKSRVLELEYASGEVYQLSFEFLRVHSPSAEVQGHGPGQEVLQYGKQDVLISGIEPSGNYAILIIFDDGHDSGIFSWDNLYRMCQQQDAMWQAYLQRLHQAGKTRQVDTQVVQLVQTFDPKAEG